MWYKKAQFAFEGEPWFVVLKPEEQDTIRNAFGKPWHQRNYQEQVKWWANTNHELNDLWAFSDDDKYGLMEWWKYFKREGVITGTEEGRLVNIAIERLAF